MIHVILAHDNKFGIGKDNDLPWPKHAEDMKWFRRHTKDEVVVMGRKTYESFGSKPLPKRKNVVVTNQLLSGVDTVAGNIESVLNILAAQYPKNTIWVIGGKNLYLQALPFCRAVFVTKFDQSYDCDTYLPTNFLHQHRTLRYERRGEDCTYSIWSKE